MVGGKKENDDKLNIDFIALSEAAKLTGYSLTHLNLLARSGKLRAMKIGRNWHTTKEWANQFLEEQKFRKENEADWKKLMKPGEKDYLESERAATRVVEKFLAEADRKEDEDKEEDWRKIITDLKSSPDGNLSQETDQKKSNLRYAFSIALLILLIFGGMFIKISEKYNNGNLAEIERYFDENDLGSKVINENFESGRVMGEESVNEDKKMASVQESENYVIDEVSFGAGVILAGFDENKNLEISDVRSESFLDTKKNEVKMLVSWKTNKPAKTEISYSKNNGTEPRRIGEDSYGYSHATVIPELEPKTSYIYKVKGNDKWGNVGESNYFGTFTTSKPISVFELITKALDELFGWAFKKQQ